MPFLQPAAFDMETRREIKDARGVLVAARRDHGRHRVPRHRCPRSCARDAVADRRRCSSSSWSPYVIIGAVAGVGPSTLIAEFQGRTGGGSARRVLFAVGIYVGRSPWGANVDDLPSCRSWARDVRGRSSGCRTEPRPRRSGLTIRFLQPSGPTPPPRSPSACLRRAVGLRAGARHRPTLFTGLVTFTPSTTGGIIPGSTLAGIDWPPSASSMAALLVPVVP